jgi:hypothetical protein
MNLDELIEWARRRGPMTPDEIREQRRSFAYGNCHIENDRITREMVAEADERLFPRGADEQSTPAAEG